MHNALDMVKTKSLFRLYASKWGEKKIDCSLITCCIFLSFVGCTNLVEAKVRNSLM